MASNPSSVLYGAWLVLHNRGPLKHSEIWAELEELGFCSSAKRPLASMSRALCSNAAGRGYDCFRLRPDGRYEVNPDGLTPPATSRRSFVSPSVRRGRRVVGDMATVSVREYMRRRPNESWECSLRLPVEGVIHAVVDGLCSPFEETGREVPQSVEDTVRAIAEAGPDACRELVRSAAEDLLKSDDFKRIVASRAVDRLIEMEASR